MGRCAYSDRPMRLGPHTAYAMSLERVDNDDGYTRSNCVLIAVEFNSTDHSGFSRDQSAVTGSAKWSKKKFDAVQRLRTSCVDLEALSMQVQAARQRNNARKMGPRPPRAAEDGEKWCFGCSTFKPVQQFNVDRSRPDGIKSRCKTCTREADRSYHSTLRGFVMDRLNHRSRRATLSEDDVLDMILQQGGRCYYSGLPLELLKPHTDWRWSMERLNPRLGYTQQNTVLVADEFNSWSSNKGAQWSRAKAESFWGPFVNPDPSLWEAIPVTFSVGV